MTDDQRQQVEALIARWRQNANEAADGVHASTLTDCSDELESALRAASQVPPEGPQEGKRHER